MKKVFFFTPYLQPSSNAAAVRTTFFANGLNSANIPFEAYTTQPSALSTLLFFKLASNKSSSIVRLLCEALLGLELFIRILLSPCQLFFLSSPPFVSVLVAHYACRIRGKPYILDIRDLYPEVFQYQKLLKETGAIYAVLKKMTRKMYQKSALVITVSNGLKKSIQKDYQLSNTPCVVQNGFDIDLFSPSHTKNDQFTVLSHGNLGKFQNIQLLIDVCKKTYGLNKNIQFHVYGDGAKASELKNHKEPNLQFFGEVDYQRIPSIVSKAHLGVSFRNDDDLSINTFPVKVFEYLGGGIPTLITPIGEMGQILEKNQMGFQFTNNQSQQIAQKINEFEQNKELYSHCSQKILKQREEYSRQKQTLIFVNELKKILDR